MNWLQNGSLTEWAKLENELNYRENQITELSQITEWTKLANELNDRMNYTTE